MATTRDSFIAILSTAVVATAGLCGCGSPAAAMPAAASAQPDVAMQPPTARAGSGPARPWRYRCDGGLEFSVQFGDGAATMDAMPGGSQVLLRDAGGATPRQTVYSNERMRVEFGLGESGREALVREAGATDGVHCVAQ
jgi:hypothetical protein